MTKQILVFALALLLVVSCSSAVQSPAVTPSVRPPVTVTPPVALPTQTATIEAVPQVIPSATSCASQDLNKMADSIVEDYPFTSSAEIITWFCDGAALEDILIALATEEETGTPAEDMLVMRADGLDWDEIWQTVGLAE